MPKTPIVFGSGLDRQTGVMAMRPGGMEDLRNVHVMQGKFQVRRGFEKVLEFADDLGNEQTDVLGGIAMRGRRTAVYVTYDEVNRKVNVFYGGAKGLWASYLGEWPFKREDGSDILTSLNDAPPVVILAEYNNIVFLAHSVNSVGDRAQTYYVEWNDTLGQYELHPLTVSDWSGPAADPGGEQKVRFRGVTKHKEYMIGWGWGTADVDRPELVRVSEPGEVTEFRENHYWIVGDQGDLVIACHPVERTLLCFKETETWELFGDSFFDFGQERIDIRFGMLEPRLAVQANDMIFAWTNEGPRLYDGYGPSRALEPPLELTLPEPFDLPPEGDSKYAFAAYMPVYRSVWFFFGQRVYALYMPDEGPWSWTYEQLTGFTPLCGFELPQAGWGLVTQPTGYPSNPTAGSITDTSIQLEVTNNDQDGDETLEVWLREAGGSWELMRSFEVTMAATQTHELTGLKPGWDYDVAVRYRRGPYYTAGYESDEPMDWPASARDSFTTTLDALPTINGASWSRTDATTEQITLDISPPYIGDDYDVEIRRDGSLIHTEEDVSGRFDHADTGIAGETNEVYDCRLRTPYVDGAYTATRTRWAGPSAPTITALTVESDGYEVDWTNAGSWPVEIWDDMPTPTGDFPDTLQATAPADEIGYIVTWDPAPASGTNIEVGVRHKKTTDGVDDFSEFDTDTGTTP